MGEDALRFGDNALVCPDHEILMVRHGFHSPSTSIMISRIFSCHTQICYPNSRKTNIYYCGIPRYTDAHTAASAPPINDPLPLKCTVPASFALAPERGKTAS